MNDEIRKFGKKIEETICPRCQRVDLPCAECPVQEFADMCRADDVVKKTKEEEYVARNLISKQQFEYLCDVGVVSIGTGSYSLVKYPVGMTQISLLDGNMKNDLLKDTPWSIRLNTETHESPDTRVAWSIPDWLFMENQKYILQAYFGSTK